MTDKSNNQQWEYLKEIGEAERHFNTLEAKYRVLASTWMLASFAGIGFVTDSLHGQEGQEILLCLLSAGGSIGIIAIWILDMLGYHKLLGAYFLEGIRIELENQDLPQTRRLMIDLGTVGKKITLFYYLCSLAPVSTGLILLLPSFFLSYDYLKLLEILALGVVLAAVLVAKKMIRNPEYDAKYKELEDKHYKMASKAH